MASGRAFVEFSTSDISGDWWFPAPEPSPHVVTGVHRRDGRILVTDQYGTSYSHPNDAVVPTAVPDTRASTRPALRRNPGVVRRPPPAAACA